MNRPICPILKRAALPEHEERALGWGYKLVAGEGQYGLDTLFPDSMDIDEGRMSVVIPFADGNRRDGVGDLLEVEGIRTERHRANPICLFDHGKNVQLPIGLAEDPDSKAYTVYIDPISKTASAQAFFYQGKGLVGLDGGDAYDHAVFCEQLFDLISKRYVRAGSIGYQVIKAFPLEPDFNRGTPKGLHLTETLLLEVSAVVLPANSDTVRKMLAMPKVCGKPLSPYLVKSLQPYAEVKLGQGGKRSFIAFQSPITARSASTFQSASTARSNATSQSGLAANPSSDQALSSYKVEGQSSMKKENKSFAADEAKLLEILSGRELTINEIAVELNATPRDIRSRLDELIRTQVVRKRFIKGNDVYFLASNSKSLRLKYRKGEESMNSKTKEMDTTQDAAASTESEPVEEGTEHTDEEGREEKYGAQVLRAFHRDHQAIMQDYDAMLGPLENVKVRRLLEKKMAQIDKDLSEAEEIFGSEYSDHDPLESKDMEGEAVEDDSREEELPTPDEAAEGMAHKDLNGKQTKVLRSKYRTKKKDEDENKRCGRYDRCKKGVCPKCGKESCSCKGMGVEGEHEPGDEEHEGNPGTEMPDVAGEHDPGEEAEMQEHEKSHIMGAHGFLSNMMNTKDWTDSHRMDAYHHGKNLLGMAGSEDTAAEGAMGMKATEEDSEGWQKDAPEGEEWAEQEAMEPQHQMGSWRKMCKGAGDYFMELSKATMLTDEHRTKAAHWHKQMDMYSNDEMNAGGAGPEQTPDAMDAAKGLKATFTRQGEMLANLLKKLATLGVA